MSQQLDTAKEIKKVKSKKKGLKLKDSKGTAIALPEMLTMIRQPNSVTNAKYDYTLTQQRVFISIIKELQTSITQHNNGGVPIGQLNLFTEHTDIVRFVLPLKEICKDKTYYEETIQAVSKIANIPFHFAAKNPTTGADALRVGGLFTAYMPNKYDRSITIDMHKEVGVTARNGKFSTLSSKFIL